MNAVRGDQYQGTLQVGQRVYCGLYGGKWGVVSHISGEQVPQSIRLLGGGAVVTGGRAEIGIAFDDHTSSVPECIIRGVQWTISDEVVDLAEVQATITKAAQATADKRREEQERKERQAQRRMALPAEHPHLTPAAQSKQSPHALGAKNLRKELTRAFSGVTFSVTSDSYSGGNSIDVKWTDGPTTEAVERIAKRYERGSFDGMTDCYNYDHSNVWPDVFGGAKYVMCSRSVSVAHTIKAAEVQLGVTLTPEQFNQWGQVQGLDYETGERIRRVAWAFAE